MSGLRLGTHALAALLIALLVSCAPDAWVYNKEASGFNGYLDTVTARCQPLWVGQMQLTTFDASSAPGQGGNFDMLLDLTSRLYYHRMTPAAFRDAVRSQFMAESDPRTNRSIDCMIAQLPSDRPERPGAPIKSP